MKQSEYYSGTRINEEGYMELIVSFDYFHNVVGKIIGRIK